MNNTMLKKLLIPSAVFPPEETSFIIWLFNSRRVIITGIYYEVAKYKTFICSNMIVKQVYS